jgi:hypothetical protein
MERGNHMKTILDKVFAVGIVVYLLFLGGCQQLQQLTSSAPHIITTVETGAQRVMATAQALPTASVARQAAPTPAPIVLQAAPAGQVSAPVQPIEAAAPEVAPPTQPAPAPVVVVGEDPPTDMISKYTPSVSDLDNKTTYIQPAPEVEQAAPVVLDDNAKSTITQQQPLVPNSAALANT